MISRAFTLGFLALTCCLVNEAGANYRMGIGDVVEISVLGEKEFSGSFKIAQDGTIDYPYLKKIKVDNKTVDVVADDISTLLQKGYLKDPQVNVSIKEYNSQKIMVVGAVTRPGTFVLKGETKVIDAISLAGGIGKSGGKKVILIRGGSETQKLMNQSDEAKSNLLTESTVSKVEPILIDYYGLIHQGDFSQNLVMKDGDILNIPEANEIFVLGNVSKPGPVKFEEKMTIVQAVTLAGGTTPTASTKSTYILRHDIDGQKKIPVRLDKVLSNKEKNIILLANDVIVIPESFF
ncbi:MAG: polysaccharide biosynthesis/export family protein [Bdellovibrionales bacterium]|nr:polysaccharide biosynthesis/export family protein [Bdellovibrionales bacterium]